MAGLKKTDYRARITWLGFTPDRSQSLRSTSVETLPLGFEGHAQESHGGLTRPSCGRVAHLYPRGTEIRNTRQLSILSAEEMAKVAAAMEVDAIDPEWLGAGIVVEGIADFSHLPPSSRLQAGNGTTLTVDVENGPCHLPVKVIDEDAPGKGRAFKAAAQGLRGVVAWVERPGELKIGDELRLFVPDQQSWQSSS